MATDQVVLLELDPALRAILAELFAEEGLGVTTCKTLRDVGSAITGLPGQVAVVDEQDVEVLVADSSQCHPRRLASRVPVVVLTSSERAHPGLDACDVSVVSMPFDVDDLLEVIRGAIVRSAGNLVERHR